MEIGHFPSQGEVVSYLEFVSELPVDFKSECPHYQERVIQEFTLAVRLLFQRMQHYQKNELPPYSGIIPDVLCKNGFLTSGLVIIANYEWMADECVRLLKTNGAVRLAILAVRTITGLDRRQSSIGMMKSLLSMTFPNVPMETVDSLIEQSFS